MVIRTVIFGLESLHQGQRHFYKNGDLQVAYYLGLHPIKPIDIQQELVFLSRHKCFLRLEVCRFWDFFH